LRDQIRARSYMETLWYELKLFGISVSLSEPGFVRTGISHASRVAAKTLAKYDAVRSRAAAAIRRSVEESDRTTDRGPGSPSRSAEPGSESALPRWRSSSLAAATEKCRAMESLCIRRAPNLFARRNWVAI
jgi:short-subunit dehydrogenase